MADWLSGLGGAFGNLGRGISDITDARRKDEEFKLRKEQAAQEKLLTDLQLKQGQLGMQKTQLDIANIPKTEAQERAKAAISLFGVHALDQPDVMKDLATAGLQMPTEGVQKPEWFMGPSDSQTGASIQPQQIVEQDAARRGITPHTGAVIPSAMRAAEAGNQQKIDIADFTQNILSQMGGDLTNPTPGGAKMDRTDPRLRMALDMMGRNPNEILGSMPKSPQEIAAEEKARREAAQPFVEALAHIRGDIAQNNYGTHVTYQPTTDPKTGLTTFTPITNNQGQAMAGTGQSMVGRMTADDSNRMSSIRSVQMLLDPLEELSKKIHKDQGIVAKMKGGVQQIQASLNLNNDVSAYTAYVTSIGSRLSRGAMGEVGVLTDKDFDRALSLVPPTGDSLSLADQKIKLLRGLVNGQADVFSKRVTAAGENGVLMPGQQVQGGAIGPAQTQSPIPPPPPPVAQGADFRYINGHLVDSAGNIVQ